MHVYNLKIERYDTEPRMGWYMCHGSNVLEALEDAFVNYPGLRESYQNLVTWELVTFNIDWNKCAAVGQDEEI